MAVSEQAIVIGILGGLALLLSAAVGVIHGAWTEALIGILVGGLTLLIYMYDVNCTVYGRCGIWAWIKTLVIGVGLAALLVVQTLLLFSRRAPKPLQPAAAPAAAPSAAPSPAPSQYPYD